MVFLVGLFLFPISKIHQCCLSLSTATKSESSCFFQKLTPVGHWLVFSELILATKIEVS